MIITQKKPIEEPLAMLEGVKKVAIVGAPLRRRLPDRRREGNPGDENHVGGTGHGGGCHRPARMSAATRCW